MSLLERRTIEASTSAETSQEGTKLTPQHNTRSQSSSERHDKSKAKK